MPKMRKPSINSLQFDKEIKRIQKLVHKIEKSGLMFIENPVPEKPKRITKKKLEEVQSITLKVLKEQAYKLDTETGEISKFFSSKRGKTKKEIAHKSRSIASKKGHELRRKNEAIKNEKPSAEELHRRRSEAARRGWETRRRRQREEELRNNTEHEPPIDPDFSDLTPPDVDTPDEPDIVTPNEPDIVTPVEPDDGTQDEPDIVTPVEPDYGTYGQGEWNGNYGENTGGEICLNNIFDILNTGNNRACSNYCIEYINDTIDMDGLYTVLLRLENATGIAVELAGGVAYESDSDTVKSDMISLLSIINGGTISTATQIGIGECIEEDFGYNI